MKVDSRSASSIWVVVTKIVTVLFATLYSILSKFFLGDKATALMGSTAVVNSYNRYIDIALDPIVLGVTRRSPELLNQNNLRELRRLNNTSFTVSIIIACFGCILNLFLGYISENRITQMLFFTMAFASVFKVLNRFITVQKSAVMQLVDLSKTLTISMLFTYVIAVIVIYIYGTTGFYIATFLITSLSGIVLFLSFGLTSYSLMIDISVLRSSIKDALPMITFGLSEVFIFTFDKLMLSTNISIESLGIYNFSFQSSQILFGLVVTFMGSMYSFYVIDIEKSSSKSEIFTLFDREISTILGYLSHVLLAVVVFFECITKFVLIDFEDGLYNLYLFTSISILFSSHYIFYIYLLVLRKNTLLIKISLISIAASYIIFLLTGFVGITPFHFAVAVVLSYLVRSLLLVLYCSKVSKDSKLIGLFLLRVLSFGIIPALYFMLSFYSFVDSILLNVFLKISICIAFFPLIFRLAGKSYTEFLLKLRLR